MLTLADYLDQQDLINLAIRAHFRKNKKPGVNLIIPGQTSSVEGDFVYLRSGNRLLACYNHVKKRFTELTPVIIKRHSYKP